LLYAGRVTLILTLLTERIIVQVSDRLVTRNAKPEDPLANKSVLFFAKDALVAIGYSGLARIHGVATDQWIAEKLWGSPIEEIDPGRPWAQFRGPSPSNWPDLGRGIERIRGGLQEEFHALPRNRRERHVVAIAGWQRRARRAHPVAYEINNGESASSRHQFVTTSLPRYWQWEPVPDDGSSVRQVRYMLSYVPQGHLSGREISGLLNELAPDLLSPEKCAQLLIDAIRRVARKTSVVGPDCMSITIPLPKAQRVDVQFAPAHEHRIAFGPASYPAVFGPWMVSPGGLVPPMVCTSTYSANLGTVVVVVSGPADHSPPMDFGFIGPQRRPQL
jgi:hypothetical protein